MRKVIKNSSIIILFILLIAIGICFFAYRKDTQVVKADAIELEGNGYKTTYLLGKELDIPKAVLTYENEEYIADGIVTYPNGKCLRADSVTLDELGEYTVEYKATIEAGAGKRNIKESVSFKVADKKYSVANEKSSVTYGEDVSQYASGLKGLNVALRKDDVLRFNEPIDLNVLTQENPIVKLYLFPENKGYMEVQTVQIILTDCYDDSNYITLEFVSGAKSFGSTYSGTTYARTGASIHSRLLGCFGENSKYAQLGHWLNYGMDGESNRKPASECYLGMSMNYAERKVYPYTSFRQGDLLVGNLTDLSAYDNIWNGFTTGEVFLSIKCEDYIGSVCNFFVPEVIGVELDKIQLVDTKPPVLNVNYEGYTKDSIPNAIINCNYPVFSCKAYDLQSEPDTMVKVYYNYYSADKYRVLIKNGHFLPTVPGLYVIEYTATDKAGNQTVVLVPVYCQTTAESMSIKLGGDGDTEAQTYSPVKVQSYQTQNSVGNLTEKITAKSGETEIEVKNGEFTPTVAGTYSVKYEISDFVGQIASNAYEIQVDMATEPVFLNEPLFERNYISGKVYKMPTMHAINPANGKIVEAEMYVTDGQSERRILNNSYTPVMSEDGNAGVRYYVETEVGNKFSDVYALKLVNVKNDNNELIIENYFNTVGCISETGNSYTQFSAKASEMAMAGVEDAQFEYIRATLSTEISLKYSVATTKGLKKLTWLLTDKEDSSVQISFSMENVGQDTLLYINGAKTIFPFVRNFTDSVAQPYELTYSDSVQLLSDKNKVKYTIDKTLNGDSFNGFPSGYAYITCIMEGASDDTKVNLYLMNGQPMINTKYDTVGPNAFLTREYAPSCEPGQEVTIFALDLFDMLDTMVSATVTVRKEDGSYVVSKDGNVLNNYPIAEDIIAVFDSYGKYFIQYNAADSSYNTSLVYVTLQVYDMVAPTITLENAPYVEGNTLHIPKATATDNFDPEVTILVYVENATGNSQKVTGETFELTGKGTYYVKYLALDKSGNTTWAIYKIIV